MARVHFHVKGYVMDGVDLDGVDGEGLLSLLGGSGGCLSLAKYTHVQFLCGVYGDDDD